MYEIRLEAREGFVALLSRIAANGARTILVETANRFARDLIVQETGAKMLREQGHRARGGQPERLPR
jgi:hypothetical protein